MAARISPSQAKNFIRRALVAIIDPPPSMKALQRIWDHFDSRCAYCDVELVPGRKAAHYDHLVSKGGNHLGNLVLSCAKCNEEEKLDLPWEDFLDSKAPDPAIWALRAKRIHEWRAAWAAEREAISPELVQLAEQATMEVLEIFERKIEELRSARPEAQRRQS
jgi:hypothetical protein